MGRPAAVRVIAALLTAMMALGAFGAIEAEANEGPVVSLGDTSGLERDDRLGSIMMPVFLSEPATEEIVVSYYTVNQTAIYFPPEDRVDPELFGDYQRRGLPDLPRTISIPAGAVQTTINIRINTDTEVEADETFLVRILSVSGANAVIGRDTGVATIVDPDLLNADAPVFTVSQISVVEGNSAQRRAQFYIHLSRPAPTEVSFSYATMDGSAVAGSQYVAKLPGSVAFAPGQVSKTIDVLVNPDASIGDGSSFSLVVSLTGGFPVEDLQTIGNATILDDDQPTPQPVQPAIAAGNNHTCALRSTGQVFCWGLNAQGQLGDGTTTASLTPVEVTSLAGQVSAIAAGDAHTCALTTGGGVKCWGNNANGQLGNGTSTFSTTPVDVVGLTSGVMSIGTGDNHSCAGMTGGGVKCWGWGTRGQLGQGSILSSLTPVDVQGLPAGATAPVISAGFQFTCAAMSDGSARCWGRNQSGQLGVGTTIAQSTVAVQPVGLGAGVTDIVNGGVHACAVQNGGVKCWGLNTAGQVGNGTATPAVNSPASAIGISTAVGVAAGGAHSCALLSNGSVSCWGLNQEGELGIGNQTLNNVTTPTALTGLTGQVEIRSGVQHVCALGGDETIRCWGINTYGQLGSGDTIRQFSPVLVLGL